MNQYTLEAGPNSTTGPESAPHGFFALAFVDSFALRELAFAYPEAKRIRHQLQSTRPYGGRMFVYSFGAVVFYNVAAEAREAEIARLSKVLKLDMTERVVSQQLAVREGSKRAAEMHNGTLNIDRVNPERASVIAATLAQSVAMEYYEGLVDEMFRQTGGLVARMQRQGTVGYAMRTMQKFVGRAVSTRNRVLSVLHRFEAPGEIAGDARLETVYEELRLEFDLGERYQSLEIKLDSVRDAAELILEVARDRRLVLLEILIAFLILFEIAVALVR
jgi:required for meiotic nuclear division protein 1